MYFDSAQPQVRRLAAELYTERHDYLLAIARRNAHTEADAAEALQEAFASRPKPCRRPSPPSSPSSTRAAAPRRWPGSH